MLYILNTLVFIYFLAVICSGTLGATNNENSTRAERDKNVTPNPSRRILRGRLSGETRPYMVYLRAAAGANPKLTSTNWLCGGVIIHERYILTSAACIEDAQHFYVISGTHKWIPADVHDNECINNGAKRAIWKCVPKAYSFDGDEFDNIRWMIGDIAVVKVEDDFNFKQKVRGCDFIPSMVNFNNQSRDLEKSGTTGSAAGWGATASFSDMIVRSTVNSNDLLETDVTLMSKNACKKRWEPRYHFIIEEHMICSRDGADDSTMSAACEEHEIDCKELVYSDEEEEGNIRRKIFVSKQLQIDTAGHVDSRRRHRVPSGGFCENDHGGPLIVGHGKSSMVVGIMSACLTKEITRQCYGPYLYTSVYKYRNLISCAINKDIGYICKTLLRSSTTFKWSHHVDRSQYSVLRTRQESMDRHNNNHSDSVKPKNNSRAIIPLPSKHQLLNVT